MLGLFHDQSIIDIIWYSLKGMFICPICCTNKLLKLYVMCLSPFWELTGKTFPSEVNIAEAKE
jgi:hypothetical protein